MPLSDAGTHGIKPREKACKVSDVEGLNLDINLNGSKLWRMKYRLGGKGKLLPPGRIRPGSSIRNRPVLPG